MRYSVPTFGEVEKQIRCLDLTDGIPCSKSIATDDDIFEVWQSNDYMDYTHSCTSHLHGCVDEHTVAVRLIWEPAVRNIDILFDGPPGPEAGRFVDAEVPEIGIRRKLPLSIGEWVKLDDSEGYWALRIPVPAGWLVG